MGPPGNRGLLCYHGSMKKIIVAALVALGLVVMASPASATAGLTTVSNSGLSTGSILVGGRWGEPARWVAPGNSTYETAIWEPHSVAIGVGWCVLYRYTIFTPSSASTSPWYGACGDATGRTVQLDSAPVPSNAQTFTVEFIIDRQK